MKLALALSSIGTLILTFFLILNIIFVLFMNMVATASEQSVGIVSTDGSFDEDMFR